MAPESAVLPANSVGVWAFGPSVTRFVPPGYHPEAAHESIVEKTERVPDRLADVLDGMEYHYPAEVNEGNVDKILDCAARGLLREPGRRGCV